MDKMNKLLEICKLPTLTQCMVENQSAPKTTEETENFLSVSSCLPTKHINT